MSFDTSSGISGAAQGAQMGSAFGPWGAAIGAGAGFLIGGRVGAIQEKAAKKAVINANKAAALLDKNRNALAAEATAFNNQMNAQAREERDERNRLLAKEAAVATAEIMKERTYVLRGTSEALAHIDRSTGQAKADISLQNAAADALGASAAIQYSNVDAQADAAVAGTWMEQEVSLDNLSSGVRTILQQARSMVDTSLIVDDVAARSITQPLLYSKPNTGMNDLLGLAQTGASLWSSGTFKKIGSSFGGNKAPSVNRNASLGFDKTMRLG